MRSMTTDQIHGHEIIELVGKYPEGIPVATLTEIVAHEVRPFRWLRY